MYAAAGGSAAVTSILLDHATPVNYNQQGKTGTFVNTALFL